MILNGLGFSDRPLSLAPQFFANKPVALLVREGVSVQIRVRDTGRGIPADKFDEIFEKFKRLEDPLRMETGGAGLGLFIVRQLARAMGGEVSVESELGKGSTFTVALTVSNSATTAQTPPERRAQDLAG